MIFVLFDLLNGHDLDLRYINTIYKKKFVLKANGLGIGFMAITNDVNASLLNECFELGPFYGLCKPHDDDIIKPERQETEISENANNEASNNEPSNEPNSNQNSNQNSNPNSNPNSNTQSTAKISTETGKLFLT